MPGGPEVPHEDSGDGKRKSDQGKFILMPILVVMSQEKNIILIVILAEKAVEGLKNRNKEKPLC